MTQTERRSYLITVLLAEQRHQAVHIPPDEDEQRRLLRSLMNVRAAAPITAEFQRIQDDYLIEENRLRGITDVASLSPVRDGLYLWRGDITTLRCDAIVNAANSGMTGCYQPCHSCIDNCIHTFAGIQLRNYCNELMVRQGHEEPTGTAKITPAFNLPCRYVIHTVGPIVYGELTQEDCEQLASCYRSCLSLAEEHGVHSLAFCCISTGVFHFPADRAADIAVRMVEDYQKQHDGAPAVIFNVFSEADWNIYKARLALDKDDAVTP